MAKGWDQVEQATAAAQEQRERFAASSKPQIFTSTVNPAKGGGPIAVRFLEQGADVNSYPVHEFKVPNQNVQGGFATRRETCLGEVNQECPACKAGIKRKVRGVYNVIHRNRPVLRKGQDGRAIKHNNEYIIDGYQDEVVILNVASTTAEELRKKDGAYRGLMSGDLILSASGNQFQPFSIEPADITNFATPMSENDQALAAKKHNLDEFMKPPSAQEMAQLVAKYGQNSGAAPQNTQPPVGGVGGAQGNAGVAGQANGFLAGASVPAGLNAFGQVAGAGQQQPAPQQTQQQPPQPPVPPTPPTPPVMPQPATGAPQGS